MQGNLLRSEITKNGIPIKEFLKKINVSHSAWCRKIKGSSMFNQGEIQNIIDVLSLSGEQVMSIFFANKVSEKTRKKGA